MAFCAFDDSAALFDSTPVENMFITEYMLRAPGDFVKVYLYALMLCYHPSPRMSLSAMAKDLDMQEEDVERAFKYWARDGLVRQVGDNPVCFTLANLKQLTLTQAENPGDKLYNQKNVQLIQEAERILNRQLNVSEKNVILDWRDVLELPEEVVLMLLQIEMENSGGHVSLEIAGKVNIGNKCGAVRHYDAAILQTDKCDKQPDANAHTFFQVQRDRIKDCFTHIGQRKYDENQTFHKNSH